MTTRTVIAGNNGKQVSYIVQYRDWTTLWCWRFCFSGVMGKEDAFRIYLKPGMVITEGINDE